MGFETRSECPQGLSCHRLNIPYGIWNQRQIQKISKRLLFEHTLWDLKHEEDLEQLNLRLRFEHTLWDLKQDTLEQAGIKIEVWTYPMGFETEAYEASLQTASCLNIPYGIWNQLNSYNCWQIKYVWTYPMGFETKSNRTRHTETA